MCDNFGAAWMDRKVSQSMRQEIWDFFFFAQSLHLISYSQNSWSYVNECSNSFNECQSYSLQYRQSFSQGIMSIEYARYAFTVINIFAILWIVFQINNAHVSSAQKKIIISCGDVTECWVTKGLKIIFLLSYLLFNRSLQWTIRHSFKFICVDIKPSWFIN